MDIKREKIHFDKSDPYIILEINDLLTNYKLRMTQTYAFLRDSEGFLEYQKSNNIINLRLTGVNNVMNLTNLIFMHRSHSLQLSEFMPRRAKKGEYIRYAFCKTQII